MQQLIGKLNVSCKKATELIDKRSVAKLSFRENCMLHLHYAICSACKDYEMQSKKINELLNKHLKNSDPANVPQLVNNELKKKIFERLQKK